MRKSWLLRFCLWEDLVLNKFGNFALSFLLSLSPALFLSAYAAAGPVPGTMAELRTEKIKALAKRDNRAEDLLAKAQAIADKLKETNPVLAERMQSALDQIAFTSSGISETRIRTDMELLEAIVKEPKPPTAEEIAPLQERYKKLCAQFDDMLFNKDLDRALHIHDKFVRFTGLYLWDKDKMASELERMEGLVERAPDVAYGKAQLLDTCKNKKLASVPKLVYLGSSAREEMYLTGDRRSVALIDEGCGQPLNMELAEHVIQGPDGKLSNLNECNDPSLGLPFSPPLSLWAKTRIQEGRIPAIVLKLVDSNVKNTNPFFAGSKNKEFISVADILDGKLDEYIKVNTPLIGTEKTPVLLGLFSEFDREAAATAFGADGKTPYYAILDPKLKDMPADKRNEEIKRRLEKGAYAGAKSSSAELSNKYGDPAIPDGPERVRDAWKRLLKVVNESGGSSVAAFSVAGAYHANKNAAKFGEPEAGNQVWNKLEYYWPGEGVFDWLGVSAQATDPAADPKGSNLMEALDSFMGEVRSSTWQSTPVMLVNLAPGKTKSPFSESAWIGTVFTKLIPATFPNILSAFIAVPDGLTLWSPDAKASFRSFVSSNKFYNFKLRFKSLSPPASGS